MRPWFLLFAVASALLIACNGSSDSSGVIPPAGIRATIPADFPEADARVLRALAFDRQDLPPGFELQYEDAWREGPALTYVAHYANTELDERDLLEGGLATADVMVMISDAVSDAEQVFDLMSSMGEQQLIESMRQESHWSADPELATLLEQVDAAASRVAVPDVPAPSCGWLTVETLRERESDDEVKFFDLAIALRRGRVVAMVDIGSSQQEPALADVVKLANEIAARMSVLQ
jgi:hypothetical protein